MKKIFVGFMVATFSLAVVPLFAAFEAHVINVTAKIENALSVTTEAIDFGTVFPQEELEEEINIALSSSFIAEPDAHDVRYIIRQKPKCGWTLDDGTNLLGIPTQSGHVDDQGNITCPDPGNPLRPNGSEWGQLPLLCPYLSKHKASENDTNDGSLDAFHEIGTTTSNGWDWNDVEGLLDSEDEDIEDTWIIDLKVPCFGDHCAQDWADFVNEANPEADPNRYIQPEGNEHKIFGCDLWVEVTGVSRVSDTPQ